MNKILLHPSLFENLYRDKMSIFLIKTDTFKSHQSVV